MSDVKEKMVNKMDEPVEVKTDVPSQEEIKKQLENVTWDDLVELYSVTREHLALAGQLGIELGENYMNVIESNKELSEEFAGFIVAIKKLTEELLEILKLHCKVTTNEKGETEFHPYTGKVNVDDEKHTELYLSLVLAYNGINEKITSVIEISESAILGKIAEITGDPEIVNLIMKSVNKEQNDDNSQEEQTITESNEQSKTTDKE